MLVANTLQESVKSLQLLLPDACRVYHARQLSSLYTNMKLADFCHELAMDDVSASLLRNVPESEYYYHRISLMQTPLMLIVF